MKIKETIGIMGVGNMGSAIVEGLIKKKIARPSQILAYDKIGEKAEAFVKLWKARRTSSNRELVRKAEVILLAFKPQDLFEAAGEFQPELKKSHVLISILAGTPQAKIRKALGTQPALVRAMPNLGAKVGEAMTVLTGSKTESVRLAEQIFSACGRTLQLEEKYFDLVTAISGSGPAYFFFVMELLAREGVSQGLSQQDAELLAVQTAVGAACLAQTAKDSPEGLRRMVTSKGGTTEAALKVLETKNFPGIFHQALEAALKRGQELSRV